MNADFKIRTAEVADIPTLCHLWQERQVILNQTDPRIPTPTTEMRSEVEYRFRQRITGNGWLYTGGREDQISGYITGALSNGIGIVEDMALDAHQYQPGLARGLWSALREHWLTSGVTRIAVRVARYDTVAQAFWRSLGAQNFRETLEDKIWTIPTHDQWLIL